MRCDSLNCSAKDLQQLLPIVNENQSDSGALDNVMELLVRSGRDIAEVMMMLIPEAWQNDALMPADRKAFYQYVPPCSPLPLH
jgi:glutamate synthase (NADH)